MDEYRHTHESALDGSPAMLVAQDAQTITLVNEDGYAWTDPLSQWRPIQTPTAVERARMRLSQGAMTETFESLAGLVNELAAEQGRAEIRELIASHEGDTERLRKRLMDRLCHSNDAWSGRRNDVRRAYQDGIQDAVRDWTVAH